MNYRLTVCIFLTLASTLIASAQGTKGTGRGPTTGPTTTTTSPNQPSINSPNMSLGQKAFISGKVVLEDGSRIPEAATIQTICRGRRQIVAHTDSHGGFTFEFGDRASAAAAGLGDAEVDTSWNPSANNATQRDWRDCELLAELSGFTSQPIDLGAKMSTFESTDVGRLVLHRMGQVEGLTVSATSAMAPKEAQKAFEKGREKAAKQKWDEAQQLFEKAVQIYPKYAAAWFELGRLQLRKGEAQAARSSFEQSQAADPKYVNPYRGLAELDMQQQQWQPLVTVTDQLLALNPVSFPDAWYRNSLGHYYLHNFDAAEKSARQGMKVDESNQIPKLEYLLAMILMQKHQYQEAAARVQHFLHVATQPSEVADAQKQLAEITRLSASASQPSSEQAK